MMLKRVFLTVFEMPWNVLCITLLAVHQYQLPFALTDHRFSRLSNNAQLLAIDSINYYWFCQSFVNQMQLLCWKRFKMLISHRALLLSLSRYVTNGVVCVCAVRQRFSAVRYQYIDIYQVTYANGRPH